MILETALADALFLNWAIPLPALPVLPGTLPYETRGTGEHTVGFFSLVLFRQIGLHARGASWLSLSYPQANARLQVRDAAGIPSTFLLRQLVPGWVVPIARAVVRQPLSAGVLDFPRTGAEAVDGRRWRLSAGKGLELTARPGDPSAAEPAFADWPATVAFFRERRRAYWARGNSLRRVESEPPSAEVVPMRVELLRTDWLETFLSFAPAGGWSDLHSAFLVPEVRLAFVFGRERELAAPAPVAAAS